MYFYSLKIVNFSNYSLVNVICFGGIGPAVYNIHLRKWMRHKCRIKSYIEVPAQCGICLDYINVCCVALGSAILLLQGLSTSSQSLSLAVLLAFLAGCFLGYGLSEMNILCSFKLIRAKLRL